MVLQEICPPALIYLAFSVTQIVIDTVKGLYNTALLKLWVTSVFTIVLNYLCSIDLGVISWFIVFIPFILMTVIVSILLLVFGLNPSTGKINVINPSKQQTPVIKDPRAESARNNGTKPKTPLPEGSKYN